jgi:hypothetical protein
LVRIFARKLLLADFYNNIGTERTCLGRIDEGAYDVGAPAHPSGIGYLEAAEPDHRNQLGCAVMTLGLCGSNDLQREANVVEAIDKQQLFAVCASR